MCILQVNSSTFCLTNRKKDRNFQKFKLRNESILFLSLLLLFFFDFRLCKSKYNLVYLFSFFQDENDNIPVFDKKMYFAHIAENSPPGKFFIVFFSDLLIMNSKPKFCSRMKTILIYESI